jgi:hypothetical protein
MNHSFDVDLATKYGVDEAIFIENMRFWIAKNKANQRHFYDGRWWTYNSAKAFSELFPYWSTKQISRIIAKLQDAGVLLSGNFNPNPYDRTKWYSLSGDIDFPKWANGEDEKGESTFPKTGKSNTDTKTNIKPDNDTTIDVWLSQMESQNQSPIPSTDPILDYAEKVGIPYEYIKLAWRVYKARMLDVKAKQKDWRASFRNYVRRDFLKLWAFDQQRQCYLTTAGKQAMFEMQAESEAA